MDAQNAGSAAVEALSTIAAVAALGDVCAGLLGAALEAAEQRSAAPHDLAAHTGQPAAPLVTLRLSDVSLALAADVARADVRRVHSITVEVLGEQVAALPTSAPALSRVLTNGACARQWASRLWRAGVAKLEARVIEPAGSLVRTWAYMAADEERGDDTRSWTLPLVQTENTPLSAELRGLCGFQLLLELRCSATETPPPCASLECLLVQLLRSTFLLVPSAEIQLEVERASPLQAPSPHVGRTPPPLPQTTVLLSYRPLSTARSKLERLKDAAAAHLTASSDAAATQDRDAAVHLLGPGGEAGAGNTVQSAGYAQLVTGAGDKRATWTVTAVVASFSAASESQADRATGEQGCPIFCFANSVLLLHPPPALLDVLRAKTTAAEWKSVFGLNIGGCVLAAEQTGDSGDGYRAPQFSACASLRFAECDSIQPPALIILHRTCLIRQPLSLGAKLPKLGRKREAALLKAALSAALRDFKIATGGGSRCERMLRKRGLPAIAAAVSKVAATGGQELRRCGAALAEQQPALPETAETDAADEAPGAAVDAEARALEKAVCASLLEVLAGDLPADLPAPEAELEVPAADLAVAEDLVRVGREHSRATSQPSDDEEVFPQRRRVDSSPPPLMQQEGHSDDEDGWFL
jgi:hypothetical protein